MVVFSIHNQTSLSAFPSVCLHTRISHFYLSGWVDNQV